jgi:4-alpha-glucanotransferase
MNTKNKRYCGILMHPTSLYTPYGMGDLGSAARSFVQGLYDAHITLWQILPLGPTGYGNSPYASLSSFAGNELLVSLDDLIAEHLLTSDDVDTTHLNVTPGHVDFDTVGKWKIHILKKAAMQFLKGGREDLQFTRFCQENSYFLDDYALFRVLYERYNDARWNSVWPEELGKRDPVALAHEMKNEANNIQIWKVLQYLFHKQWHVLKTFANERGISIVGDIPIFVAPDSADAWSNIALMKTDAQGNYSYVSGVPPDYFSRTGQLWGNPVYDWNVMQKNGYHWWMKRLERLQSLVDIIRIDHFRGFCAYWQVPYHHKTAEIGTWEKVPGVDFFQTVRERFPSLKIFAEDLGVVTPDVEFLRDSNHFPGMRIAQFGFTFHDEGILNPFDSFLPHNYEENCVAYTGTHDNQTTKGWFLLLSEQEQETVCRYLHCSKKDVVSTLIRFIMASNARYAIFPLQDVLGLGDEARMNTPSTCNSTNWSWMEEKEVNYTRCFAQLKEEIFLYGRM